MRPQFLGALAATAVVAAVLTGCSTHTPTTRPASTVTSQPTGAGGGAATEVINAVAVDSSGQPVNGYHEITSGQPIPDQADCTEPSPAAVSHAIYRCWPAAYGADVCWPASGLELLCMNAPWAKQLHRIRAGAALPSVSPPAKPTPVALALADGTQCRLRNGGAWGHRHDDLVAFYGCVRALLDSACWRPATPTPSTGRRPCGPSRSGPTKRGTRRRRRRLPSSCARSGSPATDRAGSAGQGRCSIRYGSARPGPLGPFANNHSMLSLSFGCLST
jgi:hypothetical protein